MRNTFSENRVTPTIRRAEVLLNQGEWAKSKRCLMGLYYKASNSGISLYPWAKRLETLKQRQASYHRVAISASPSREI